MFFGTVSQLRRGCRVRITTMVIDVFECLEGINIKYNENTKGLNVRTTVVNFFVIKMLLKHHTNAKMRFIW